MKKTTILLAFALLGAFGCSDDESVAGSDMDIRENNATNPDLGGADDTGNAMADTGSDTPDMGASADLGEKEDLGDGVCRRTPAAADRTRYLVVSKPIDNDNNPRNLYEVLTVAENGSLSRPGTTFELGGRQQNGNIVFTPDGEVGIARFGDGKLGAFKLDAAGNPTVISAIIPGDYYASNVVMHPSGEYAYVTREGWRNVQGGVYRLDIDCETDAVSFAGLVAPAKLPRDMAFLEDGRAVIAAVDFMDDETPNDLHIADEDMGMLTRLASGKAFPDDEAIISSLAITADERYAILTDNSAFSGVGNRIGVAQISGNTISRVQNIDELEDPAAVLASPHNNAVMVMASQGDRIRIYDYDPEAAEPLSYREEFAAPLPSYASMITRGQSTGMVYVSTVDGIRRLQFLESGTINDYELTRVGESLEGLTGGIGVQP